MQYLWIWIWENYYANEMKKVCAQKASLSLSLSLFLYVSPSIFISLFIYIFISFSLFSFLFITFLLEFTHNSLKSSKRQDFMRMSGKVTHLIINDRNQICANKSHLRIMIENYVVLQQTMFHYTECLCNASCWWVATTILLVI